MWTNNIFSFTWSALSFFFELTNAVSLKSPDSFAGFLGRAYNFYTCIVFYNSLTQLAEKVTSAKTTKD